jgi:hypothetical protein
MTVAPACAGAEATLAAAAEGKDEEAGEEEHMLFFTSFFSFLSARFKARRDGTLSSTASPAARRWMF